MEKLTFKKTVIIDSKEILTRDDLKRVVNIEELGSHKKKKYRCHYTCVVPLAQGGYQVFESWGSTACNPSTASCPPGDACQKEYGQNAISSGGCEVYPF